MKIKIYGIFLFLILLVTSCTPSPETLATQTAQAWTPTPEPTTTRAPEPITGTIFWDANSSGLQDETSFIVPEFDPADLPYFFELPASKGVDVGTFVPGELATVSEPDIPSMRVCVGEVCTETDENGEFNILQMKHQNVYKLTFEDPNKGNPEKEFRYINEWRGEVVIEAYEVVGGKVPEQHLNDTDFYELHNGFGVTPDSEITVGLMQGFLTLPFFQSEVPEPFIFNYFDILGIQLFNEEYTWIDSQDGVMASYDGRYNSKFPLDQVVKGELIAGVVDSHSGLDYLLPIGTYILSGAPTSNVFFLSGPPQEPELRVHLGFPYSVDQNLIETCYGHLSVQLVQQNQKVYREQIVGLSGDTGYPIRIRQLHFNIAVKTSEGWAYYDPYRFTVRLDPNPQNFWGSEYSFWTVDNIPQFPLVEMVE